jgi:hypothetical protein
MTAERGSQAPRWLAGLREGPLEALREAVPGLEICDRDLDVGEGRRADLVGIDGDGRAVAVLYTDGRDPGAVLVALDAFGWLARHRGLLAEHLESARLDPGLEPLVVLVAERYEERLLERLAGLSRAAVRCLELRVVTSRRGERTYLVPARLPFGGGDVEDPDGRRALLRALAPEAAALAEGLLRRLDRLDDELERAADGHGVVWSMGAERLCGLHAARGALLGSLGRRAGAPLRSAADAEDFLERVVRAFGKLLGAPEVGGGAEEAVDVDPDAFDPATPILTPEEIAAFQEPS